MAASYTIGELARAVGVPTSTLRYYERIGMLRPDARSRGNYRMYSDEAVGRLQFIRTAQATGFTLDDIRQLLDLSDGSSTPCAEVQALIQRRLAEIDVRLKDLRRVRRVLQSALQLCRESQSAGRCRVIEQIRPNRFD